MYLALPLSSTQVLLCLPMQRQGFKSMWQGRLRNSNSTLSLTSFPTWSTVISGRNKAPGVSEVSSVGNPWSIIYEFFAASFIQFSSRSNEFQNDLFHSRGALFWDPLVMATFLIIIKTVLCGWCWGAIFELQFLVWGVSRGRVGLGGGDPVTKTVSKVSKETNLF